MSKYVLGLVVLSVSLSSLAQIVLKTGMTSSAIRAAIATGDAARVMFALSTSVAVVGGLALYFASAVVWLFVLSRVAVSIAYPLVGIGFVFTMLLSRFVHGEPLTLAKLIGTLLIVAGVAMIGRAGA